MKVNPIIVEMTPEELVQYYLLLERDQPKPLEETRYTYEGVEGVAYHCQCGAYISDGDIFCSSCGQRLDTENIKL